jgi:hypothetical protein
VLSFFCFVRRCNFLYCIPLIIHYNSSSFDYPLADSAVTYLKAAAGFAVQEVNVTTTAVATGTTVIPIDDTIPQISEGTEFMTLAITPKSTTNILVIQVITLISNSAANQDMVSALFQDATASALAMGYAYQPTGTALSQIMITHAMIAGTTSTTTFRVRSGAKNAGTTSFNGSAGLRLFGASVKSSIVITEYKV